MKLTSRLLNLVAVALILVGAAIANAGMSGAIFTTNRIGEFVNGNVYDSKDHVYLNGGPRPNSPCNKSAGLPDGFYYFQVTDPSGHMLLSSDHYTQRKVEVADGLIVEFHGSGHDVYYYPEKCNGRPVVTIGLAPFDDTLNPGGEYKVWLSPVGSVGLDGEFFQNSSKTDNFKVNSPDVPDDPGD